ncbi:MAG: 30S ribosomal protein S6 [Thermodesulfobacteriota bacterium]
MERHYETVCIVRPDIGDDAVKAIIEKASATVSSDGGTVARLDEWGRRRLAYPIAKKNEGYYFVLTYTTPPPAKTEMERQFKLNEDVMRYQTVVLKELPPAAAAPAPSEAPDQAPGQAAGLAGTEAAPADVTPAVEAGEPAAEAGEAEKETGQGGADE